MYNGHKVVFMLLSAIRPCNSCPRIYTTGAVKINTLADSVTQTWVTTKLDDQQMPEPHIYAFTLIHFRQYTFY